nr:hypothetical protein BaRGS_010700 [Batillaria attramentaria]
MTRLGQRAANVGNFVMKAVAGLVITYGVYHTLETRPHQGYDSRTVVITPKNANIQGRGPPATFEDPISKPQPCVVSPKKAHALFLWIKVKPLSDPKQVVSSMARLPHYVYQVTGPILPGAPDEVLAGVGFGPELFRMGAGGAPKPFSNEKHHLIKRKEPEDGQGIGGDIFIHAKSHKLQHLMELGKVVLNSLPVDTLEWSESIIATDENMCKAQFIQEGCSPLGIVNHQIKTGELCPPPINAPSPSSYPSPPCGRLDRRKQAAVDPANGGSYVMTQKWVHKFHVVDTGGDTTIDTFMGRAWDDCVSENQYKNKSISRLAEDIAKDNMTDWMGKAFSECQELRRRNPKLSIECKPSPPKSPAPPFRLLRQSMPFKKEDKSGMFFIAYAASPRDHDMLVDRLEITLQLQNCGDFVVYCLYNTPACAMAYCVDMQAAPPVPQPAPVLEGPEVINDSFRFVCRIPEVTGARVSAYDIRWTFDGQVIENVDMVTLTGDVRVTYLNQEAWTGRVGSMCELQVEVDVEGTRWEDIATTDSCLLRMRREDWNATSRTVSVSTHMMATRDFVDDGNQELTVRFRPVFSLAPPLWNGYQPPQMQVLTVDRATRRCSGYADPHVQGFERAGVFHMYEAGDYVFMRSERTNFELAFASGQWVRVTDFQSYLNVEVQVTGLEFESTAGLCGTFDNNTQNEFMAPDGHLFPDSDEPTDFFAAWRELRQREHVLLAGSPKLDRSKGHTEDGAPHTEGVALMLAPEAQRALIGWEPVNSRIITAKFITKKKDIKLNIIQCYAPTNDAEEEKKDDFYQQLQTVIDRGGAKDMTILMGDFNAKIGSDNTGYEDTMGTHGLGQMNENGERFADFCALNQLVIGGSIFPHKRIHKATWRSPDHITENQIDHICISRKFRRSWRDVRVMRGADVSSDHHLLATTLRLRLKRHTNANSTRTRYNVGLLRNTDTQAAFRISLSNRFQPLQDLIEDSEMDIETQWEHSKKLWHDTCEEVLGKRKTQHKEWISADTIQKLEVRKEKKTALNTSRTRRAKAKAQEEYTAADREVKRSTRKDKRDYIDNLASQAEEAARQGNLKDLYQVTKKLAGKFQQTDKPVKDKNGHPLTTTEEQLKRWAEHFRELLNRPIPETPPDIPPAETELPINCDKPSKAEIRKAIMTLRNGKAAGPDEIPAEAIKADTETAVNMLHSLFSKIWEKEEVPAQWKEGIVIKLPKKGDLRDCSNYRGIMLLSVPGKVLNRILLERMREAVDPMLRDQQAGFRRNRSCADQIASLRIIVEQSLEWNSPLYINFIDYEKAFDSVDREALWKLLRHYGVPGKIISLIQCTYQDMSCRIAHAGQLSESFEVKTGVRQGCLLSPFLFLLVIDWIMKTTTAGRKNGIQWTLWTQLDDLDFADDLALLSHSHSQMQDKTTCLEATSAGTGLKINRKKTELMKINTTANTPVTVGGEPIREVESFVYLGSVVDGQGGTDRDVTARIGKARAAMVMLKNVWASKVVSIRTKLRIFNSNVKSVLLYGCETWRTTKTMQQKIQTFLNTCLRRIFNIRWPEKIRNEELWERAGQEPVAKQILRRKWGWIGHTLRKPASSTTRQALTWNPQGKRKRGRPRNSWRRDTEAELCKQGTNWTGVARLAQNRVRWRRVVDGLCSTWSQGPKPLKTNVSCWLQWHHGK